TAGSSPVVRVLARRQRSLTAVHHCFCCRAAVVRPRAPLLVTMTLVRLGYQAARVNSPSAVLWLPPFKESEATPVARCGIRVSTSKPISPVCLCCQHRPDGNASHRTARSLYRRPL